MDYIGCTYNAQQGFLEMLCAYRSNIPEENLFRVMASHKLFELQGERTRGYSRPAFLNHRDANTLVKSGKYTSMFISKYCREGDFVVDNRRRELTPLILLLQRVLTGIEYIITGEYMMLYSLDRGHTDANVVILTNSPYETAIRLGACYDRRDTTDIYLEHYDNLIRVCSYGPCLMDTRNTLLGRDDCLVYLDSDDMYATVSWYLRGSDIYSQYSKLKLVPLCLDTRVWNKVCITSVYAWKRPDKVWFEDDKSSNLRQGYVCDLAHQSTIASTASSRVFV